jgi:hypothetical protein
MQEEMSDEPRALERALLGERGKEEGIANSSRRGRIVFLDGRIPATHHAISIDRWSNI